MPGLATSCPLLRVRDDYGFVYITDNLSRITHAGNAEAERVFVPADTDTATSGSMRGMGLQEG